MRAVEQPSLGHRLVITFQKMIEKLDDSQNISLEVYIHIRVTAWFASLMKKVANKLLSLFAYLIAQISSVH